MGEKAYVEISIDFDNSVNEDVITDVYINFPKIKFDTDEYDTRIDLCISKSGLCYQAVSGFDSWLDECHDYVQKLIKDDKLKIVSASFKIQYIGRGGEYESYDLIKENLRDY